MNEISRRAVQFFFAYSIPNGPLPIKWAKALLIVILPSFDNANLVNFDTESGKFVSIFIFSLKFILFVILFLRVFIVEWPGGISIISVDFSKMIWPFLVKLCQELYNCTKAVS